MRQQGRQLDFSHSIVIIVTRFHPSPPFFFTSSISPRYLGRRMPLSGIPVDGIDGSRDLDTTQL